MGQKKYLVLSSGSRLSGAPSELERRNERPLDKDGPAVGTVRRKKARVSRGEKKKKGQGKKATKNKQGHRAYNALMHSREKAESILIQGRQGGL